MPRDLDSPPAVVGGGRGLVQVGRDLQAPSAIEQPSALRRFLTWGTTPFHGTEEALAANKATMEQAGPPPINRLLGHGEANDPNWLAGAKSFVGGMPGAVAGPLSAEGEARQARFGQENPKTALALGLAGVLSSPVPGVTPHPASAGEQLAEQIARVRAATKAGAPAAKSGALSTTLDLLIPSKVKLAYKLMKRLAGDSEAIGGGAGAYPKGESYIPVQRAVAQVPEVAQEVNPALSAAADRSRASIFERLKSSEPAPAAPIPEEPFTPVPRRLPPTPQPTPAPDPNLAAAAQARRASILETARQADLAAPTAAPMAPAATAAPASGATTTVPATVGNAFESAMRASKVANLTKAVEANAVAHLGADTMSPQFAEAIGQMPEEWWHGIAQVANVNKPSRATIDEVTKFFSDRAAQTASASARRVAGQ